MRDMNPFVYVRINASLKLNFETVLLPICLHAFTQLPGYMRFLKDLFTPEHTCVGPHLFQPRLPVLLGDAFLVEPCDKLAHGVFFLFRQLAL